MSIENPRFIPPTPESVIASIEEHASLPELSADEMRQLEAEMTQEQILDYYSAVDNLGDEQKRQEILDRWIPKPKKLYHASRIGTIEEFEPRGGRKRSAADGPQVFGAVSKAVAAMMMAPGDDRTSKSGSYDNHRSWIFIYIDSSTFRQADTGGYMYELPPDTFTTDPNTGLGLAEWTSVEKVKPVGQPEHYTSSIEAMLQHGVNVYPVDEATFKKFRVSHADDIELLKTLKPLQPE